MPWKRKPGKHRRRGAHAEQETQQSPQVDTEIVDARVAVAASQRLQDAAHARTPMVRQVAESITFLGQRRLDGLKQF